VVEPHPFLADKNRSLTKKWARAHSYYESNGPFSPLFWTFSAYSPSDVTKVPAGMLVNRLALRNTFLMTDAITLQKYQPHGLEIRPDLQPYLRKREKELNH
jgi:hypothetical protein